MGKASPTNERVKVETVVFHTGNEWAALSQGWRVCVESVE